MPNTSAAIGLAQLENINNILKKKEKINFYYKNSFSKVENIEMINSNNIQKQNFWLNVIKIKKINYLKFKKNINELIKIGIDVRPVWYPCHMQDHLKKYETYKISFANKVYKNTLCLPSSYFLKINDLSKICKKISNVFKKK